MNNDFNEKVWADILVKLNVTSHVAYNCIKKMQQGVIKHGQWIKNNPNDKRNFYKEIVSEQIDSINYAVMGILKGYDKVLMHDIIKHSFNIIQRLETFGNKEA